MKKLVLLCLSALACGASYATPDWATGVAPILYNHCTSCHHSGGIAPFSLITYDSAVAHAGEMRADVMSKKMPPWPPDPSYARLAHERILSTEEVNTIVNWVNGGTPQGSPSSAPPPPTYSNNGMIQGTPDLKVKIPTYTSTASTGDVYQCFVIPSGLLTDKYIRAFEAVPGNPACVHHVLVFADTTGTCAGLDAAYPGPGYPDFGGVGTSNATMVGVWVPGSDPMTYPPGFGLRLPAHSDIVVQVHYPAGTAGLVDSTEVRFYFAPTTGVREVYMEPILYHGDSLGAGNMTDGPLVVPPNTVKTFHEKFLGLPIDMTILGAFPHMHLLGQSIESYAVHPAGDTDKIIRINKWDFHWQGFYMMRKLKKVPANSQLFARATYDNTTSNPENPNSPPDTVVAGEKTTNEMMIVFFVFTIYQPGDESIIVDSTLLSVPWTQSNYYHGQQLLDVVPNPASTDIIVKCFMENPDVATMELVDMQGKTVRQFSTNATLSSGYSTYNYSVAGLPPGSYTLVVKTSQQILSKKMVVVR